MAQKVTVQFTVSRIRARIGAALVFAVGTLVEAGLLRYETAERLVERLATWVAHSVRIVK
ncbi:hypothetical protein [Sagittula sp. S175]|uniref:hypothetical protein n=1 Tax=Sagittula sp. S175 TaxID=3415129 RepID=UPI003C7B3458